MNHEDVFTYLTDPHARHHGPLGYANYKSFKPWLRDEFRFRCVYCLWREVWCADGEGSFSVDHIRPIASHPALKCDYDNLAYACCRCNSVKQNNRLPMGPCDAGWGNYLGVAADGTVRAITAGGEQTIETCRLNRPALVLARRRMLAMLQLLAASETEDSQSLLREYLTFPANLPALSQLQPPGGNARPEGIVASYDEQRKRGELPETY